MKAVVAVVLLSLSLSGLAKETTYDFFELGYSELEDEDGYFLRTNFSLSEGAFINYTREYFTRDGVDIKTLGFGFYSNISNKGSLFFMLNSADLDGRTGYKHGFGYRHQVKSNIELYTSVEKLSVKSITSVDFSIGTRFYAADSVGIFLEANHRKDKNRDELDRFSDEWTGYRVGVNLNF